MRFPVFILYVVVAVENSIIFWNIFFAGEKIYIIFISNTVMAVVEENGRASRLFFRFFAEVVYCLITWKK